MDNGLQLEIEKNQKAFQAQIHDLVKHHRGRYALLRNEEIVGIYDTVRDAQMTGNKFFEDGLYSVQKIDPEPVNLGFYSHAMRLASA